MAINKVVYANQVLMDLTNDTVTAETLVSGKTAHDKSGELVTGTFTSDATATVTEILEGEIAYGADGTRLVGTMPNRADASGTISDKNDSYAIQSGYHDGSGTVEIDDTEKAKIIPGNILDGVSILGVTGTVKPGGDIKSQKKDVTPTKDGFSVLPDAGFNYLSQVDVAAIPYRETPNGSGTKVEIAY